MNSCYNIIEFARTAVLDSTNEIMYEIEHKQAQVKKGARYHVAEIVMELGIELARKGTFAPRDEPPL
jgi:hypothetical protein